MSSSFCVSFVRFLLIPKLPDAGCLCVSSLYTQISFATNSSLGCTVHRYSPRTAPSSHSSPSSPPFSSSGSPFYPRASLHRNPRFSIVCSHRPRMSLFEKGTRRRRRRYRWSGFSVDSPASWGIAFGSSTLGSRASRFESIERWILDCVGMNCYESPKLYPDCFRWNSTADEFLLLVSSSYFCNASVNCSWP